jgi:small-conductance mechanosensitive channel
MRTIIIVGLVFGISVSTLTQLGFDVGAIFTTSAILGAIIGLALQPTLGSLVAGMALSSDRVLTRWIDDRI